MPKTAGMTTRQKQFCLIYSSPDSKTFGNAKESYLKAGFKSNNPGKQAYMLIHRPEIVSYLAELEEKRLASYNWTKDQYIQEGIDTLRALPQSSAVRKGYYEIIGKVLGFFSDAPQAQVLVYNDEKMSESQNSLRRKLSAVVKKVRESIESQSPESPNPQ